MMIAPVLSEEQEALLELVKEHDEAHPVFGKVLQAHFGFKSDEQVREIVNQLRSQAVPICASRHGYFYAEHQHQINTQIKSLEGRIQGICNAINGLKLCQL
jgi:UDP-N-acetyl-D-mannosaminuronic acid transferase (WecB/TagA/CpsF family)